MWQKEKGIILGAVRHNDRTSIVHVFTEGNGHVPYIFYLTASGRNTGRNTILQPLTVIEFQSRAVQSEQLQHLREPVNIMPFSDIPFNPVKSAIALFLGEFLSSALRGENENRPLFDFLRTVISELDSTAEPSNLHLYTILKTSAFLGISPNTDGYRPGCWLDLLNGVFSARQPMHSFAADPENAYRTIRMMECSSYDEARRIPLTGSGRASMLSMMNDYFRIHMPDFPNLKSLEILQAVFS